MKKSLKFACPVCGCTQLEEVIPSATVTTRIANIDPDGDHGYSEEKPVIETNKDSGIFFQCFECGHVVVDGDGFEVSDCAVLSEWLKEQPYNRREE